MIKNGRFIVIEGTDGVGKATQVALLRDKLESLNIQHQIIDFPRYGDNLYGKLIRSFLDNKLQKYGGINPYLFTLAYAGDRSLAKDMINGWLEKGELVIANRYLHSNVAYSIAKLPPRIKKEFIKWNYDLEYATNGIPKEELVILLYANPKLAQKNIEKRGKKDINEKDLAYQQKVAGAYLYLAKTQNHWEIINCTKGGQMKSKEEIHYNVMEILKRKANIIVIMKTIVKKARQLNPPLQEKYSKTNDLKEEIEARKALAYFVTDPDGAIYATTSMVPELFAGLLKARYSRTELSAKQLLWREFVSKKEGIDWHKINSGLEELEEAFNFKKAEGVAERILLQYGDDSVFELSGAHLFLDRVSMVASKIIEDSRIGLSPLEKSTRYVIFDQKDSRGDYLFFKDPKLMGSKHKNLFLKTTRDCFKLYARSVAIFLDYFQKQLPLEKEIFPDLDHPGKMRKFTDLKDEKSIKAAKLAYSASVRAKACDISRSLLPASTLTNIGEFGNARSFGYLFTKMMAMPLTEARLIAGEAIRELKKVLPKFFDVVDNDYGRAYQQYLRKTAAALQKRSQELFKGIRPQETERVELVEMDADPEINIAAALLYPYSNLPLKQIIRIMKQIGPIQRGNILHSSLKYRTNRRHKPPRAFEIAGYELTFDILGNFGIYRDLHRQRMLTQQRQNYTTLHGSDMPLEFKQLGLDMEFRNLMKNVKSAHDKVLKDFPDEAQYLTTMANYTRWYMGMNLREGFWLTELRSVPQGHFSYRVIAQEMFIKAAARYPFLKKLKNHFVDMTDRSKNLERMKSQQKIQVKLSQIEEKYSSD